MKKTFVVVAFVLICTLAAMAVPKDTIYNFTLLDTGGGAYCNSMWIRLYTPGAPAPKALVGGYYANANCAGGIAPAGGFKHAVSPTLQYGTGAVLDVSTPAYGSFNWEILVNPATHTWTSYRADDNYGNYLVNYGTWQNGYLPANSKTAKDVTTR
ncbi:MAG: hypothetical protein ACRD3Q_03390 [Terriglobales bacterium]